MESIKSFFAQYGWGFIMLVGSGLIIAMLVEIIVKNSVKWLEKKWEGHEKALAVLQTAKIITVQVLSWAMSIWFAQLVVAILPLPGGETLLPIWVSLIYVCQYIFSCFGIKGILEWMKRRAEKAELKAEQKAEAETNPLEGLTKVSDSLWTDGQGGYFMLKGRKVVKV